MRGWMAGVVALAVCGLGMMVPRTEPVAGSGGTGENHLVGDAACVKCHTEVSKSYAHTAHHLTSQMPSGETILGSFKAPDNTLVISSARDEDARLAFVMEARADGFYETARADLGEQHLTRSERMDLVVGNGTRGQTYLYWKGDSLFELPVSFWSEGRQWINSPGYRDGTANFARHVNGRCLECHATYIKATTDDLQGNAFERTTLRPGIGCESCHGPGAAHVAVQSAGVVWDDRSILNPARFSRERQIDQCALCHNGTVREELAPAFSYKPGEDLARYLAPDRAPDLAPGLGSDLGSDRARDEAPDVHGNQVGLLERSACFRGSAKMTCGTCHNTHAPEKTAAEGGASCLQCHKTQSCPEAVRLDAHAGGKASVTACVGCHMPMVETKAIVSETAGRTVRTAIRTHWIKVYR